MEKLDDLYEYFQNLTKLFGDESIRLSRYIWRKRDVLFLSNMTMFAGFMLNEALKIRDEQITEAQNHTDIGCIMRMKQVGVLKKEIEHTRVNLTFGSAWNESYNLFKNYFDIFEKRAFESFVYGTKMETNAFAVLASGAGQRLIELMHQKEGGTLTREYKTVSQKIFEMSVLTISIGKEYTTERIQRNLH